LDRILLDFIGEQRVLAASHFNRAPVATPGGPQILETEKNQQNHRIFTLMSALLGTVLGQHEFPGMVAHLYLNYLMLRVSGPQQQSHYPITD
jgi:hypothetical protein